MRPEGEYSNLVIWGCWILLNAFHNGYYQILIENVS